MRRSLPLAFALPWLLAADGWRHDGTGVVAEVSPPASWAPDSATWKTALPAWGNASPVRFGSLVCVTAEPTTVVCLDADSGRTAWTATNDRLDTLGPEERAATEARLARIPELEATLNEGRREIFRLRREARRPDAPDDLSDKLASLSASLDADKAALDTLAGYRTDADRGMIGYGSPTHAADGDALYVLTGNGVLSRFDRSGDRTWGIWLGPEVLPMRGYDHGSVSSPLVVGDRLIVGHRHLRAIDRATGEVQWTDDAVWNHYGTPAILDVEGLQVVLTPDGRALAVDDGRPLAAGLGDIFYVGPVVHDDMAWWIGGKGHRGDRASNRVTAWRLSREGEGLATTEVFDVPLPSAERVYTTPLVHDDRLYVLDLSNTLSVLDAATGAQRGSLDLDPKVEQAGGTRRAVAYTNPVLAGDRLFLGWQPGVLAALRPGDQPEVLAMHGLGETMRGAPTFEGDHMWVRTLGHLWLFEGRTP